MTRTALSTSGLLTALLLTAAHGQGALITNGTPDTLGASLEIGTHVGAESFTLGSTTTIRGIEFADFEFQPLNDSLNYYIFSSSGFYPDMQLAQGSNPTLSKTILSPFSAKYDFNLNSAITLGPGTYWIGLNFSGGGNPSWVATTTPNAQLSASLPVGGDTWTLNALQVYLGISDTPLVAASTPEPGSLLLGALGLGALLLSRRRKPQQ